MAAEPAKLKHQISTISEEPPIAQPEDALLEELKAIAGGGTEYIGSLTQVEVLFSKIPTVVHLRQVHNLIEVTCKSMGCCNKCIK